MHTLALLAALTLGVDAGYEPAADGQLEYILQIEPQLVAGLVRGQDLTSEIPPGLDVRHFRVTIGNAKLPRNRTDGRNTRNRFPTPASAGQDSAAPADAVLSDAVPYDAAPVAAGVDTTNARVGYQPLDDGRDGEYVIEINPDGLGELDNHDLTGDIPPNLAVTRFRVSSQVGTAPPVPQTAQAIDTGEPRRLSGADPGVQMAADVEPPLESLTPAESNEVSAGPADPSFPWHADPLATGTPPVAAPPSQPPQLAPDNSTAGPPAANLTTPRGGWRRDEPPAAGPAAPSDVTRGNNAPGNGGGNWDTTGGRGAPGQMAADSQGGSLPAESSQTKFAHGDRQGPAHAGQKSTAAGNRLVGAREKIEHELEADEAAFNAKTAGWHWFPLTVTLALFVSIGANLYLAWIAWDARTRCRSLVERFHAGELTAS